MKDHSNSETSKTENSKSLVENELSSLSYGINNTDSNKQSSSDVGDVSKSSGNENGGSKIIWSFWNNS